MTWKLTFSWVMIVFPSFSPQQALMPQRKRHWCRSWKSSVTWETTWILSTCWEPALSEVRQPRCAALIVQTSETGCRLWLIWGGKDRPHDATFFLPRPYTCDNRVLLLRRPSQLSTTKERILHLLQDGGRLPLSQHRAAERRCRVRFFFVC